ncbi:protein kinase domain-containing protein [Nesterenkonia muleiensis]|uniref:protein kinase domain-containing protein n=1 Tax=Nesterenkonia muleiensis TaxID=2282648 RepID=UPI0013007850|nr:protein kinase [Nesterenkonia muleiensis]
MVERLDNFRLEGVIGVGSFATVYRAVDERLNSTVVVKVLAENHSLNPEIRERFIAEGRALRRVPGSHVTTIHDIGESDRQQPYLVLEHADRGTVQERVDTLWRQGWRAGREDVLVFARHLAAAVDSVHRVQLVHRDLSPGNLLIASKPPALNDAELTGDEASDLDARVVRSDERLLIADLGMCKDLAMNSGLTVSGGTAGFRPPEQDGPGVVDIRADIWAMSAVLRWLAQDADLPAGLQKVLKRGLATKPTRRQPDAATWLAELEEALAPQPAPDPAQEPISVHPEPVPEDSTGATSAGSLPRAKSSTVWSRLVVAGIVFCAAAVGVLVGLLLERGGEDAPPSSAGGVSISIAGPDQVEVGEPAVFTAETEGADSWVWVLPTGTFITDEPEAVLTPTSPGSAEIVLRTRAPDGSDLEVRHALRVTE